MILTYQSKVLSFTVNKPQDLLLRLKQQVHQTYTGAWYGYAYGDYDYVINVTGILKTKAKHDAAKAFIGDVGRNNVTYIDHNQDTWLVKLDINQTRILRTNRALAELSLVMIGNKV